MAVLVPAIHEKPRKLNQFSWMPGARPDMTSAVRLHHLNTKGVRNADRRRPNSPLGNRPAEQPLASAGDGLYPRGGHRPDGRRRRRCRRHSSAGLGPEFDRHGVRGGAATTPAGSRSWARCRSIGRTRATASRAGENNRACSACAMGSCTIRRGNGCTMARSTGCGRKPKRPAFRSPCWRPIR